MSLFLLIERIIIKAGLYISHLMVYLINESHMHRFHIGVHNYEVE